VPAQYHATPIVRAACKRLSSSRLFAAREAHENPPLVVQRIVETGLQVVIGASGVTAPVSAAGLVDDEHNQWGTP
jgi:hypothetical protein